MILDDIIAATKIRVEKAKQAIPLEEMKQAALVLPINQDFPFEKALTGEGIRFICECKKASPSKGVIVEDFPYIEIAKAYEEAGASAISVLTEPDFFQGENRFLTEIKQAVSLPVIRKDFIIDAYQIYEAKVIGADAVLLIATILTEEELDAFQRLARGLGAFGPSGGPHRRRAPESVTDEPENDRRQQQGLEDLQSGHPAVHQAARTGAG